MLSEDLHQRLDRLEQIARSRTTGPDSATDLNEEIAGTLKELGLFKLWVPKRYGGFELDLPQTLQVYESAATIDGAVGWAVMIGAGGGLFAAYLQPEAAHTLFSPQDAVVAGSGAPNGRAERIDGGYRATGRWRYASGARYATIFTANCVVTRGGNPVLDSTGKPLIRAMSFAPSAVTIIPTWNATGMRSTGSHDIEVRDVFIAEDHTFSIFTDPSRESGPLYRLPFDVLTQLPVAAVASGIAGHALSVFAALAAEKRAARSDTTLADSEMARSVYAQSHARWLNTHLALHGLASRTWEALLSRGPPAAYELAEIASSCALFVSDLQDAVQRVASISGMNAVANDSAFARAWRDLQTLAAHASVSPQVYGPAGSVLLKRT